jgi:myo-inositol 2-dehydrogenase / D-chiro-inositol 1-dehydrogenase
VLRQTRFFSLDSVKSGLRILASDDVITQTGRPEGAHAHRNRGRRTHGAFHAGTLGRLPGVDSVVVADADRARVRDIAGRLRLDTAESPDALLRSGIDALVIATATDAHAEFIVRGAAAGLPVCCEKPVAPDIEGTLAVIKRLGETAAAVQIGFQRRFDAGYRTAREAVRSGAPGWVHTLRATTLDPAPPRTHLAGSGGPYRDCRVHDFDAIRRVTGRDVVEVYAVGTNRGADFFRAAGDGDTMAVLLTLDDDSLALVSGARYNAAGYDMRLEVLGPPYPMFIDRFAGANQAELAAFVSLATDGRPSPCTAWDALAASYIAEACETSRAVHRPAPTGHPLRRADHRPGRGGHLPAPDRGRPGGGRDLRQVPRRQRHQCRGGRGQARAQRSRDHPDRCRPVRQVRARRADQAGCR